jgi:hypothetical protein
MWLYFLSCIIIIDIIWPYFLLYFITLDIWPYFLCCIVIAENSLQSDSQTVV